MAHGNCVLAAYIGVWVLDVELGSHKSGVTLRQMDTLQRAPAHCVLTELRDIKAIQVPFEWSVYPMVAALNELQVHEMPFSLGTGFLNLH